MRISHSGRQMHTSCSEKYRLHYIEKLRSPKLFSSLFFGSALDEAFSRLLLDKKKLLTPEETLQLSESADEIFYKHMCNVKRDDGAIVEVSKSPFADYYSSDYTPELLTDKAISLLHEYAPDICFGETAEEKKAAIVVFMECCKAVTKAKKKLSAEDIPLFNYITWLTLVEKGYLMLQAYLDQIMPQIFEVYSIQEKISLKTGTYQREVVDPRGMTVPYFEDVQDEISGLIDFTCSFVDDPGTMYVCDNKTSSKPYKKEETGTSDQLATYCEYKQTNKAAYVVIEKAIYKKHPQIHTQILKADIAEEQFTQTFDQFEKTLYSISTEQFEKNFKSCFSFGRMCPFFSLCKHNNGAGLIKKEDVPVE